MNEDREMQEAVERLATLFSDCHGNPSHLWNIDTGKCDRCGTKFPYADDDK